MENPFFAGIKLTVPSSVYAPHEDSLLLAAAVKRFARGRVLDLGTGSGLQAIVAAKKKEVTRVVAADVNRGAIACAKSNAAENNVASKIVFVQSNLFHKVGGEKFDCIAFNPPYLPTSKGEKVRGGLNKAFDGGRSGRKVMDEFIAKAKNYLLPGAIVLLVSSSLSSSGPFANGNEETLRNLRGQGFRCEVVGREKFFFEEIVVLQAEKK